MRKTQLRLITFAAMTLDESYMRRCFELAMKADNDVGSNPFVGAIIVYKDKIIGEGWHQKQGTGHGEVNAYNSVKEENKRFLAESTIYVNLEPCFHFGKTPPCVDLILREKFKRVVISCIDPYGKVAGKSIAKLRENGVEVKVGVLEKEGRFIARRFITNVEKERPYIILKYAQSEDGFIGQQGKQVWLTNPVSKRCVHKWRSQETAIMIGTNTAEIDNPNLTTRLYKGPHPIRVILDRKGRLNESLNVFNEEAKTILISEKPREIKGVENILIDFNENFLPRLMTELLSFNIKSIIIEGGAKLLQSFINENLWDEARVFTAPVFLGSGIKSPQLPKVENIERAKIGTDGLTIFYADIN